MNNKKELITKQDLHALFEEFIFHHTFHLNDDWCTNSMADRFYWFIRGYRQNRISCICVKDKYWEIYNNKYEEENVNIIIFKNHAEFDEDSKFIDFTKEEMYSLYTFLKERIFGNNTERLPEIIKDPTNVNIYKHIKSVMQRYPEDSPEYKVLYDLYNTIRCSFNTEYGMSVNALKPDYEALITHATNLVNNFDKETQSSDDIKEEIE